jgi:predicted nucleic acid-binding protein
MRVVLDTNIVVRFIYSPSGFIVGLVRLLQPPQHALITSVELIQEAADVLARPRGRRRSALLPTSHSHQRRQELEHEVTEATELEQMTFPKNGGRGEVIS